MEIPHPAAAPTSIVVLTHGFGRLLRLLSVFTREHPLALFLDNLQWLDAATLDLMEDLLTRPDVHHLMLIGADGDNEVDPTHPLVRRLEGIPPSWCDNAGCCTCAAGS